MKSGRSETVRVSSSSKPVIGDPLTTAPKSVDEWGKKVLFEDLQKAVKSRVAETNFKAAFGEVKRAIRQFSGSQSKRAKTDASGSNLLALQQVISSRTPRDWLPFLDSGQVPFTEDGFLLKARSALNNAAYDRDPNGYMAGSVGVLVERIKENRTTEADMAFLLDITRHAAQELQDAENESRDASGKLPRGPKRSAQPQQNLVATLIAIHKTYRKQGRGTKRKPNSAYAFADEVLDVLKKYEFPGLRKATAKEIRPRARSKTVAK